MKISQSLTSSQESGAYTVARRASFTKTGVHRSAVQLCGLHTWQLVEATRLRQQGHHSVHWNAKKKKGYHSVHVVAQFIVAEFPQFSLTKFSSIIHLQRKQKRVEVAASSRLPSAPIKAKPVIWCLSENQNKCAGNKVVRTDQTCISRLDLVEYRLHTRLLLVLPKCQIHVC